MVLSVESLKIKHLPCIAHTLQLILNKGFNDVFITEILKKCRNIVSHFKKSSKSLNILKELYEELNKNLPFSMLQQDVCTRFNSSYFMLSSILKNKQAIAEFEKQNKINSKIESFSDMEWDKIKRLATLMQHFVEATDILGGENYVSISNILPVINALSTKLVLGEDDPNYIMRIKGVLNDEINLRMTSFRSLNILKLAVVLDPRYKKLSFVNESEKESFWNVLYDEIGFENKIIKTNTFDDDGVYKNTDEFNFDNINSDHDTNTKSGLLLELEGSSEYKDDSIKNFKDEIFMYRKESRISTKDDPLLWWDLNKKKYPLLSNYARCVLSIPATSIPCERLFSSSGYIVNKMRSSLSPGNVKLLVCLRNWLNK